MKISIFFKEPEALFQSTKMLSKIIKIKERSDTVYTAREHIGAHS